jgi:Nif-specific regulatory protein
MRRVDTRIVAATNRDLAKMVAERTFRADLWYRLNGMMITVPPLRTRPEDVVPLAEHFLSQANREFSRRWRGITLSASRILQGYSWPGNVRELKSIISRAALLHDAEELQPEHLPLELLGLVRPRSEDPPAAATTQAVDETKVPTLAEVELLHIRRVLELCHGNRTLAAQHLGITRQTLAKKVDSASEAET